jgi:hypothetical protein
LAKAKRRPRYVDLSNPSLSMPCPRCGLLTPRFSEYCGSCGYAIWPDPISASAAFRMWRDHDLATRSIARPYDLELPRREEPPVIDYAARAHELGIHVTPSSRWPIVITIGMFFLFFALIPLPPPVRIVCAAIGAVTFLAGVVGWVLVEDPKIYPGPEPALEYDTEHAPGNEAH